MEAGEKPRRHDDSPNRPTTLAYSPDGENLTAGAYGRYGDPHSPGEQTRASRFADSRIDVVAFGADGRRFAAGGGDFAESETGG